MSEVLNIGSRSEDWRARCLSNFSAHPFVLEGETFASVEGFIQGIKFPPGDSRREEAFRSVGREAKKFGRKAEGKFVWWKNLTIQFGTEFHRLLIIWAIRAKFEQNEEAREALLATKGMILTHDLGHPESPNTSLPAAVFCEILMKIREEMEEL